jgi:hypothetical protein
MFLPQDQDWRFYSRSFLLDDLWQWPAAEKALHALESVAAPEYWGEGTILSDDYRIADIERHFRDNADPDVGRAGITIKRSKPPRYTAWLNVTNYSYPHLIKITSNLRHSEGELEQLFHLVDALSGSVEVDFGTIDLNREGQDPSTRMLPEGTGMNLEPYIDSGPEMIWVRNYIGPRVVALAKDYESWQRSGGLWRHLPNGELVLDLDQKPWDAKPETLKAAQQSILPKLIAGTGVFHPYDDSDDPVYPAPPGPRWKPPPGAHTAEE